MSLFLYRFHSRFVLALSLILSLGCESPLVNTNLYLGDASPLATGIYDMGEGAPEWYQESDTQAGMTPSPPAGMSAPLAGTVITQGGMNGGDEGGIEGGMNGGDEEGMNGGIGGSIPTPTMPVPIETQVTLQANGFLQVETNLPVLGSDCHENAYIGLSCADEDQDGLVDQWEMTLLELLRPTLRFYGDDDSLETNAGIIQLGRVFPQRMNPLEITLNIVTLFEEAETLGVCSFFDKSNGDLELSSLLVTQNGNIFAVSRVYLPPTRVGTHRYYQNDKLSELMLLLPNGNDPYRWLLYSLFKQHTLFITRSDCRNTTTAICNDNCSSADGVSQTPLDRTFPIYHVGEANHPLMTDLGAFGYTNESVWSSQPFCGGNESRSSCYDKSIKVLLEHSF